MDGKNTVQVLQMLLLIIEIIFLEYTQDTLHCERQLIDLCYDLALLQKVCKPQWGKNDTPVVQPTEHYSLINAYKPYENDYTV